MLHVCVVMLDGENDLARAEGAIDATWVRV